MGLDMYFHKRKYVKNWEHGEDKFEVIVKKNGKVLSGSDKASYVEYDAGYWRKANAIHNWFIEHCANGEDSCTEMDVSNEQASELLETVNKVLAASKLVKGKIKNGERSTPNGWEPIMEDGEYIEEPTVAKELLPTQGGFFFGSTDYDQYYYQDLLDTKKILEDALAGATDDDEFTYRASW